jgi:hypothetical protein
MLHQKENKNKKRRFPWFSTTSMQSCHEPDHHLWIAAGTAKRTTTYTKTKKPNQIKSQFQKPKKEDQTQNTGRPRSKCRRTWSRRSVQEDAGANGSQRKRRSPRWRCLRRTQQLGRQLWTTRGAGSQSFCSMYLLTECTLQDVMGPRPPSKYFTKVNK